jgi:hypothetical protein
MTYDQCRMNNDTLILVLQKKIKEDMEIPENVHYNEGIIDAIEEVKKQDLLEAQKKQTK